MTSVRQASRSNLDYLDGSSIGPKECNIDGDEYRRVIAKGVGAREAHGQHTLCMRLGGCSDNGSADK